MARPQSAASDGHREDDDILMKQIHSDLAYMDSTQDSTSSKKKKKRSREAEIDGGDAFDSSQKKKKRKEKAQKLVDIPSSQALDGRAPSPVEIATPSLPKTASPAKPARSNSKSTPNSSQAHRTDLENASSHVPEVTETPAPRRMSNHEALVASIRNSASPHRPSVAQILDDSAIDESVVEADLQDVPSNPSKKAKKPSTKPIENPAENDTPPVGADTKKSKAAKKRKSISHTFKLPEAYQAKKEGDRISWYCPVVSCDKEYSRRDTLKGHINTAHVEMGDVLEENDDGTLTVVGSRNPNDGSNAEEADADLDGPSELVVKTPHAIKKARKQPASKKGLSSEVVDDVNGDAAAAAAAPVVDDIPTTKKAPKEKSTKPSKTKKSVEAIASEQVDGVDEIDAGASAQSRTIAAPPAPSRNADFDPDEYAAREDGVMEDWEITPGKVRSSSGSTAGGAGDEAENVAFSSTFIDRQKLGIKLPGIAFKVHHFPAGATKTWATDAAVSKGGLRVCSVSSGKVRVTLGQQHFTIGMNGMWRIKSGQSCKVVNRHYNPAVVHVSTLT